MMTHQRSHRLEKFSVQITAAVGLCAVYFEFGRVLGTADPLAPITFLPGGNYLQVVCLAAMLCLLGAVCAITTLSSRAEGALMAALLALGGVSLNSPGLKTLLWSWEGNTAALYARLAAEVILLGLSLLVCCVLIDVVRDVLMAWLCGPAGMDASADAAAGPLGPAAGASGPPAETQLTTPDRRLILDFLSDKAPPASGKSRGASATQGLFCVAMGLGISMVLLLLLMQSGDRGQILFALVFSMAVAVMAAHQTFPMSHGLPALAIPLMAAILFYALGAFTPLPAGPEGWTRAPLYARALPIDWLTAGGGGALLGYWISARIHELRLLENEL